MRCSLILLFALLSFSVVFCAEEKANNKPEKVPTLHTEEELEQVPCNFTTVDTQYDSVVLHPEEMMDAVSNVNMELEADSVVDDSVKDDVAGPVKPPTAKPENFNKIPSLKSLALRAFFKDTSKEAPYLSVPETLDEQLYLLEMLVPDSKYTSEFVYLFNMLDYFFRKFPIHEAGSSVSSEDIGYLINSFLKYHAHPTLGHWCRKAIKLYFQESRHHLKFYLFEFFRNKFFDLPEIPDCHTNDITFLWFLPEETTNLEEIPNRYLALLFNPDYNPSLVCLLGLEIDITKPNLQLYKRYVNSLPEKKEFHVQLLQVIENREKMNRDFVSQLSDGMLIDKIVFAYLAFKYNVEIIESDFEEKDRYLFKRLSVLYGFRPPEISDFEDIMVWYMKRGDFENWYNAYREHYSVFFERSLLCMYLAGNFDFARKFIHEIKSGVLEKDDDVKWWICLYFSRRLHILLSIVFHCRVANSITAPSMLSRYSEILIYCFCNCNSSMIRYIGEVVDIYLRFDAAEQDWLRLIALIAVSTEKFGDSYKIHYMELLVSKAISFHQRGYSVVLLVLSLLLSEDKRINEENYLYDPSSVDVLKSHIFPEDHVLYATETKYITFLSENLPWKLTENDKVLRTPYFTKPKHTESSSNNHVLPAVINPKKEVVSPGLENSAISTPVSSTTRDVMQSATEISTDNPLMTSAIILRRIFNTFVAMMLLLIWQYS